MCHRVTNKTKWGSLKEAEGEWRILYIRINKGVCYKQVNKYYLHF